MKTLKQISLKSLAMLLSVLMILSIIPATVLAEAFDDGKKNFETLEAATSEKITTEEKTSEKQKLTDGYFEVEELREENVKHFRLSDGTYMAIQYEEPVHYLGTDNKWKDIDNTLTAIGSEYTTNNARLTFAKTINGNESLFTLHEGNHKITMSLEGANKNTQGSVINNNTKLDQSDTILQKLMIVDSLPSGVRQLVLNNLSAYNKQTTPDNLSTKIKMMTPVKLSSSITYANILNGVDLEYMASSNNIKENIIVKSRTSASVYKYNFTIELDSLLAELCDDGSVSITDPDTNDVIYIIPKGYMYDANGAYSNAVTYALIDKGNGVYTLTVTADPTWINNANRVYPVTIDPSVSVPSGSVIDVDISSNYPNYTGPQSSSIVVSGSWRGYWKTSSLPSLPDSAYIIDASISLYSTSKNNNYIGVYQVTSDWGSDLTWNKTISATSPQGVMSNNVLDYNYIDGDSAVDNRYRWNITSLVKSWYAGTSNYGVGFKTVNGTTPTTSTVFSSSEISEVSYRPQLVITYKDMKGVESYWSYSSQNAGLAGTSYVNNATGSMILSKPLLSTTDSLMPYTPTIVYNSALSGNDYKYPNAQISYYGSYMPLGFKLNIQETLVKKKYISAYGTDVYYYIWADADGTEHAFMPVGTSTSNYEDEDGLQLKLSVANTTCTITDDNKIVKTFTKLSANAGADIYGGWYLTSITDKNNNAIIFTFDSYVNPIKISMKPNGNSIIDFLEIKYNSNHIPYMVWNPTTKEAIVFRYSTTPTGSITTSSTKYLRELVYARGDSSVTETNWLNFYYNSGNNIHITVNGKASYTYNTSGYIIKANDELSGYAIQYSYSSGKVYQIQEYAGTAQGQRIGFNYYTGYTEVRNSGSDDIYGNSDDLITRYTFDKSGRAVGMYSTDSSKTQIYGATSGEYESEEKIKNNIKTATSVGGSATNYLLNGGFETVGSDGNAQYWTKSSTNIHYYSSLDNVGGNYEACFDIDNGRTDSIYQYTKLPEGTYTLSMSVNTYNCKNVDVYITAQSMNNSTHTYTEKVSANECYASGGCAFFSKTFDARNYNSSGGEFFKIIIRVVGGNIVEGEEVSVSVDNVMLEEGIGNSNYSLIQLGNFEGFSVDSNGTYLGNGAYYWISDSGNLVRGFASEPFGYAGYLYSSIKDNRYLKQTVYEASSDDLYMYDEGEYYEDSAKSYVVSGFAKGTGQVSSPHSAFRIRVDVTHYMGSDNEDLVVPYYYDFQNDCKDWQFVCGSFKTEEYYLVRSIVVYCEYAYQPSGYAMFDNISLVQSTDDSVVEYEYYGQTLTGDQRPVNEKLDGLLRSKKSGYYTEIYEYNDDRQLIRTANNRGEIHDYTYDTNGVDVKEEIYYKFTVGNSGRYYPYFAANPEEHITKTPQTRTVYSYNAYGELLSTSTCEAEYNSYHVVVYKSGSKYLTSSYAYNTTAGSKLFGTLLRETDSLGRNTRYYYDNLTGRLLATVAYHWDSNQCEYIGDGGTCYTYDALGNVETVNPANYSSNISYLSVSNEESVEYAYDGQNRLENITTDSTAYHFTYDAFGNTDTISVGSRELASYDYNAYNGKLNTINYGNGFSVHYVYDRLDNIKEVWYTYGDGEEELVYEYTYTAYGQLYRFDNLLTGKSVIYKYDTAGKITNFIEYDTDEMVNEFSSAMFYDEEGRLQALFYTLDYSFASGIVKKCAVESRPKIKYFCHCFVFTPF